MQHRGRPSLRAQQRRIHQTQIVRELLARDHGENYTERDEAAGNRYES